MMPLRLLSIFDTIDVYLASYRTLGTSPNVLVIQVHTEV